MTRQEALQAIAEGVWRQEEWSEDLWEYRGEEADGEPSWVVCDRVGYGWVERTIGSYEQGCDWRGYDELVRLARAMDAAHATLEAALDGQK